MSAGVFVRQRDSVFSAVQGLFLACAGVSLLGAGGAQAQVFTTLVTPAVQPDYQRDRNVSVLEQPHPDFDTVGIHLGSFYVVPQVTTGIGASNNVYEVAQNKVGDIFGFLQPALHVNSDWSSNQVGLDVSGDLRRYLHQVARNQDAWQVASHVRLDVDEDFNVRLDGQAGRIYESPYTSDAVSNEEVLSYYYRIMGSAQATYTQGRVRIEGALDTTAYTFNFIRFPNGSTIDQTYRNRVTNRASLIAEYALSPSASLYTQTTVDQNKYQEKYFFGQPNRDSTGYQIAGGISMDLAGLLRGSLGVGYTRRSYKAAVYQAISGVSVQGKVDLFPTPITTVTLTAQRLIQDSSLGNSSGYIDTRFGGEVDHEVLENLILTGNVAYYIQSFPTLNAGRHFLTVGGGGTFWFNHSVGVKLGVTYAQSHTAKASVGVPFAELSTMLSLTLRR
ncbi:MAG: outer membrane beta-barrel protein [Pseudomonadota bacterium]|nr:outer membrane beta-barrel protein [Pseudomonadota bacterium]